QCGCHARSMWTCVSTCGTARRRADASRLDRVILFVRAIGSGMTCEKHSHFYEMRGGTRVALLQSVRWHESKPKRRRKEGQEDAQHDSHRRARSDGAGIRSLMALQPGLGIFPERDPGNRPARVLDPRPDRPRLTRGTGSNTTRTNQEHQLATR